MEHRRRFGFTPLQKTILWVAVLLCVWRFLQVPAIFDALLKFCAAGQIPGTSVTLSADTVLWIVFVSSALGVLALFYKLFIHVSAADIVRTPPPTVAVPSPRQAPRPRRRPSGAAPHILPVVSPVAAVLRDKAPVFSARILRPARVGMVAARQGWVVTRPRLVAAGKLAWRGTRVAVAQARSAAIISWRASEPYARQFDAWLGRRLNGYAPTARLIRFGRTVLGAPHTAGKPADHEPSH